MVEAIIIRAPSFQLIEYEREIGEESDFLVHCRRDEGSGNGHPLDEAGDSMVL